MGVQAPTEFGIACNSVGYEYVAEIYFCGIRISLTNHGIKVYNRKEICIMAYEVISSEKVFKGKVFDIERDVITLPDGRTTSRETVRHNGACAMIAVDNDGKILFVRQYRHSAGAMTLEIPAGTLEKGEDPYDCAMRELEEETGYKTDKMQYLVKFYSSIGFCSEILYIYLADDLKPGNAEPDDDEFIELERYTVEETIKMIFDGEIYDSKTIAAVFAYKEWKERNKK